MARHAGGEGNVAAKKRHQKAYLEARKLGMPISQAAAKAGVTARAAYHWRETDEDFRAIDDAALEAGGAYLHSRIYEAAETDWRAANELLKRTHPIPRDVHLTGKDGGPMQHEVAVRHVETMQPEYVLDVAASIVAAWAGCEPSVEDLRSEDKATRENAHVYFAALAALSPAQKNAGDEDEA